MCLFYMLGCEIYFLELERRKFYIYRMFLKMNSCNEVPVNIVTVLYE